jgi:hypothetical protein
MAVSAAPSLVGSTIRRSLVAGRRFVLIGVGVSILLAYIFARSKGDVFPSTFPLELPIFAVTGSMGALLVFTNDRTKGVFEYLIAYGFRPLRLFATALVATAAIAAVVVAAGLGAGIGIYLGTGHTLSTPLIDSFAVYTVPMTFATALFVATVGMVWSALSSPRSGMNSPLGFAPTLGVIPTIIVLGAALVSPAADYYYILGGAAAVIAGVDVLMVALSGRLLRRERLLSPL